jgi:Major Facilitator Superfamily.
MINLFLLGFSSGLPLLLTASTLQAWFTVSGVNLITIGLLSLVAQPYVYKVLWAPLMDRFRLPFLGRRRGWMFLTQLLLLFAIAGFAVLDPAKNTLAMGVLALVVAFLSASQDIVVDAYRTEILPPQKYGLGAAWYVNGYRVGMILSGGLALVIADVWGWSATYLLMGLCMMVGLLTTWFSREPSTSLSVAVPTTLKQAIVGPFQQLLSKDRIVLLLLLVITYKLGDGFVLNLTNTFLLRDLGFSLTVIGTFYKTFSLVACLLGILCSGWLMQKLTLSQALFRFGIAQALSSLVFVALSLAGKNTALLGSAIAIDFFCNGMATAAFVALLMSLCDSRYTATQFAILTGLGAIGRVFLGPLAAMLAAKVGWTYFYLCTFMIYLLPVMLIANLKTTFSTTGLSYAK